ncbi:MAG TPA: AAA family ATPase [Solirubrobacteraceae bacterium]|jgi:KaiC/GvpD/RAD55 family RecA-like ATPase|nr:AAA family ATPase [Solirubrobacteraceae bacterium]
MLRTEPEPVRWVIDGIAARGTLAMLAGRAKEGKSLLAVALAARGVSGGGDLAGIGVSPLRVLVVDAENGGPELHRRVRALGLREEHAGGFEVYEALGHDLRNDLGELETVLIEHRPDLLILDSWRSLWGGDENDPREVATCLDPIRNLTREHDTATILIHHSRRDGSGYRGSGAIAACVENVVELSRSDEDTDRRRRVLRNPACRYDQEADDRWLRIEADRERGILSLATAEAFTPAPPPTKVGYAGALIEEMLPRDHAWHPAKPILEAGEADGFPIRTMQRAARQLGVELSRNGYPSVSVWRWPTRDTVATASFGVSPVSPVENSKSLSPPSHDTRDTHDSEKDPVATVSRVSDHPHARPPDIPPDTHWLPDMLPGAAPGAAERVAAVTAHNAKPEEAR